MDVVDVLTNLGGVARRRDLLAAGVSGGMLTSAVTAGRVRKPARGVFALPAADKPLLAARSVKAELSCISAAQHLGWWVLRKPSLVHISADHGRRFDGFRVHRAKNPLSAADICVQCLRCLPELDALCIVESAVVRRAVTLQELRERLGGRRDAALRRLVGQIDPHSQSIIETVARYRLRSAGLSTQSQVYVHGVGRLDLFIEGLLGLEIDGREHHSGAAEFTEDRRRWNLLTMNGIPLLRVTYFMVVDRPEEFLALVRKCLAAISAR